MASLLRKLKDLVNVSVRGPRRYKAEPAPPTETPVPEVTEAPARRHRLPEVSEAPQVEAEAPVRRVATPGSQPGKRVEEPETGAEGAEALEEERVADLLKGEQS
jgi:hypothetical protein